MRNNKVLRQSLSENQKKNWISKLGGGMKEKGSWVTPIPSEEKGDCIFKPLANYGLQSNLSYKCNISAFR